jgi:hypothetical protein
MYVSIDSYILYRMAFANMNNGKCTCKVQKSIAVKIKNPDTARSI